MAAHGLDVLFSVGFVFWISFRVIASKSSNGMYRTLVNLLLDNVGFTRGYCQPFLCRLTVFVVEEGARALSNYRCPPASFSALSLKHPLRGLHVVLADIAFVFRVYLFALSRH